MASDRCTPAALSKTLRQSQLQLRRGGKAKGGALVWVGGLFRAVGRLCAMQCDFLHIPEALEKEWRNPVTDKAVAAASGPDPPRVLRSKRGYEGSVSDAATSLDTGAVAEPPPTFCMAGGGATPDTRI